jgi:hypothetical protein
MHIDDQGLARGRLRWVLRRNRPLREKNGGGVSEKKSGGEAEDLHKGSIEKRGKRVMAVGTVWS